MLEMEIPYSGTRALRLLSGAAVDGWEVSKRISRSGARQQDVGRADRRRANRTVPSRSAAAQCRRRRVHRAVKVKVGPISVQYKGKAVFQEKDESAHRAVITASVRETPGARQRRRDGHRRTQGRGRRDIVCTHNGSHNFGEGRAAAPSGDESTNAAPATTVRQPDDAASVNLLEVLAVPVAKRVAPVAAGLAAGVAIGWLLEQLKGLVLHQDL